MLAKARPSTPGGLLARGAVRVPMAWRWISHVRPWVTGAGKGTGYATALAFVEAGANVTGVRPRL